MGSSLSFPEVEINSDRTFVITGGNAGIGYETAKHVASMGGHVIIACRNMRKSEEALKQMQEDYEKDFRKKQKHGNPIKLNVEKMEIDLASFASTMKFIEEFKSKHYHINVLVCNTGVSYATKEMTEDGHELMLQVNYLSHLLIILHFLPILLTSGEDSRIVQTTSMMHSMGKTDFDNINAHSSYGNITFYSNSKLYQVMSMYWLTRHMKDDCCVAISSCHPGFVEHRISASKLVRAFSRSAYKGATTIIKAATDPSLTDQTGIYLADCKITTTSATSRNIEKQDELMKISLDSLHKYLPSDIEHYIDI